MAKNIFDIVNRIKGIKGFKTDGEVASALGMSKTALSNHKARSSIPFENLSMFSESEGISLDWLLTGEGTKKRAKYVYKDREEKEKELCVAEPEGSSYDPWPELTRMKAQLERIYKEGDERVRAKLQGFLAALDPGEEGD